LYVNQFDLRFPIYDCGFAGHKSEIHNRKSTIEINYPPHERNNCWT
jgi:hypothetical protein